VRSDRRSARLDGRNSRNDIEKFWRFSTLRQKQGTLDSPTMEARSPTPRDRASSPSEKHKGRFHADFSAM